MNCTCTYLTNDAHTNTLCPFYSNGISYVYTPSHTHSVGTTTATPTLYHPIGRSVEPQFDDPKVEKRWEQLRGFGLDLPSNDLSRDLEEKKRILLQRGVHLREVIPAPDMGEGIVQFIAATEGVKRDGNTLLNTGWEFDNFAKNPVFLFQHDYSQLPIGQHVKWAVTNDGGQHILRVWSRFVTADIYPFAERVRLMYEKGFLRAVSIGWIPLDYEPVRNDEGIQTGWKFTRNELLEVSAVSVPADPDAIIQGINQRILEPSDIEVMSTYIDSVRQFRNICHIISNISSAVDQNVEETIQETPKVEENSVKVCLTVEVEDEDECEMEDDVTTEPTDDMQMSTEETEVRTEETPTETTTEESVVDVEDLSKTAKVILNGLLFAGRSAYNGEPFSELRKGTYDRVADIHKQLGRTIIPFSVVEHVYQCNRELYRRGVAFKDRFENATDSQLIEGLLYTGAEHADDLTDVLNEVRDAVDKINEVKRGIEYDVRVGSKISKSTADTLAKCDRCLDDAKSHIRGLMCLPADEDSSEENSHSIEAAETSVIDEIAERAAKLARSLRGEPVDEPKVDLDEIAQRVANLRRTVVDQNADAISATTKSTYIRDLLQKIIDSEK